MGKKKSENIGMNLTGELLLMVSDYHELNEKIKKLNDEHEEKRQVIINKMKGMNISKAKSQLYNVSCSDVQQEPKLAEKKLHEIMIAKGLEELWKECLYTPKPYPMLRVSLRKGGENIF